MHNPLGRMFAQDDNHVIFPNHRAIVVVIYLQTRVRRIDTWDSFCGDLVHFRGAVVRSPGAMN